MQDERKEVKEERKEEEEAWIVVEIKDTRGLNLTRRLALDYVSSLFLEVVS